MVSRAIKYCFPSIPSILESFQTKLPSLYIPVFSQLGGWGEVEDQYYYSLQAKHSQISHSQEGGSLYYFQVTWQNCDDVNRELFFAMDSL